MIQATTKHQAPTTWNLTECGDHASSQRTVSLPSRCATVGRSTDAELCIASASVSKFHARLFIEHGSLFVEDLGSTNGTYVNGKKVTHSSLIEGDLVQFANSIFKVGRARANETAGTIEEGLVPWAEMLISFDTLMSERRVIPHFQPIITMDDRTTVAYELLARSDLNELRNPAAMFGAAERLGQQVNLSELMRSEGMRIASERGDTSSRYYLNTHPVEVGTERLDDSLRALRDEHPTLNITIEIHEAAVTCVEQMKAFRDLARSLEMQVSYDDFGAGQGRLLELCEVTPDVLKFDMQLIRRIDTAPKSRQEMLAALVRIAVDLGTTPLAEGVESEAEHAVCRQMGFTLGQGFLYGRPAPFPSDAEKTFRMAVASSR